MNAETPPANRLRRELTSFGVLLLTLSCLSPAFSIYGVGGDVLQHAGTGAALLFLIGVGAAVVWALVYAELGSAFPYAGGDYVGVGAILGGWAGVVTLALWTATLGPSIAFEAKIIATYLAELFPALPLGVSVFGSLIAAVVIGLAAVRIGALVTGLFLMMEMVAVLVLMSAGFFHPVRGLSTVVAVPMAFNAAGIMAPVGLGALALSGINAVYGVVGGNQAIYFGEELGDPHRRMGRVIVIACIGGALATALPVVAVAIGAHDLAGVLKSSAPLAAFVTERYGALVSRALSAGVALAIFNAMIASIMFSARLLFSLGRDQLLPALPSRMLATVSPRTGAPEAATWVVGVFSAACCLFDAHALLVFISGLLVYAWSLVCLAVLVGRKKGLTGGPGYWRAPLHPLGPVLGLAMAAVFTIADLADADAGRPSLILLGAVALAAALWSWLVLQRRPGGWTPMIAPKEP